MSNPYGANHYKEMSIKTAGRGQLLIMLYEGAIKNVKKAADAIDKKDIQAKGIAIGKAHDIVNELVNTLNFEVGGNIARDLERLYNYIIEQLVKANFENSKERLAEAQKIMETLLSGWKEALDQLNKSGTKIEKTE